MMTGFNDFMYVNAIHPAIKGYNYIVPEAARTAAGNFFDNLLYPVRFVKLRAAVFLVAFGSCD